MASNSEARKRREPIRIYCGDAGFFVHYDADEDTFTLVDEEMQREWGPLSRQELAGVREAITEAMADES